MRAVLMFLFLGAAVWRAGADWQATIGQGYAYRLGTMGSLISSYWPRPYADLVESLQRSGVPGAWDPVGAFVMSVPLALIFLFLAATVWLARPRERRR
jgi:hypothetical protein